MRGFKITVPGKGDISLLTKDVQLFHALLESISFFYSLFLLSVCYIVDFVYFVFFYYDKEMPERTDLQVKICNLLASVLNILSSDKGSTLTNILSLYLYLSLFILLSLYVFFNQTDLRLSIQLEAWLTIVRVKVTDPMNEFFVNPMLSRRFFSFYSTFFL